MNPEPARMSARTASRTRWAMSGTDPEITVAEAAHASSDEAAEAIEEAAELNEDPAVADALEEADVHARTTVSRLDWLRNRLRRFFSR